MTYRVRDLKEALEDMPDEALIILQVDDSTTGLDTVTLMESLWDRTTGRPAVPEVVLS